MPTKSIALRIDTELLKYLEARAAKEHRTLSNMIISILLDEKEQTVNATSTENATRKEIREQLEEVKNNVENEVHPVVSPDNWYVYSNLHDALEQLEILLEHNNII